MRIQIRAEIRTLSMFLRSQCASTRNVQGGWNNRLTKESHNERTNTKWSRKTQWPSQPNQRRAKPTGRRTGWLPCSKTRGLSLQTDKSSIPGNTTKEKSGSSESESMSLSTTSGTSAPSPKKLNRRKTPQSTTSTNVEPTRRSIRHPQSTLAKALGDHIPINTIDKVKSDKKLIKLNID